MYVVIITGINIIEPANHGGRGGKSILEKDLQWIMQKMNLALTTQKEDLKAKCGGALFPSEHPKMVWIKAIQRPFIKDSPKGFIFGQVTRFNDALDTITSKFPGHITMSLEIARDRDLFDLAGRLSVTGMSRFWREVNRNMRLLEKEDHHKDEQTPEPVKTNNLPEHSKSNQQLQYHRQLSLERAYHQFKRNDY